MKQGITNLIKRGKALWLAGLLVLVLSISVALAQGGYDLSWFTISGGGGTSSSGPYTLSGTIGQSCVGVTSSGPYTLTGGFWAGAVVIAATPSVTISLTPEEATNELGTEHSITATVRDDQGQPLPDQDVKFLVTGANSASGGTTTDANGQATFIYTGTNDGDDIITAWLDHDGDDVQDPDEPFDVATKSWTLPTAVTLVSFTVASQDDQTLVEWQTGTEVDNAGFNLHRATAAAGPYTKLNDAFIPAKGDPVSGASYTYIDTKVSKGTIYYYKLEDVDFHGVSTFHGPVSATVGVQADYLPLILK